MMLDVFRIQRLGRLWRDLKAQWAEIAELERSNARRLDHLSWQVDVLQRETRLLLGHLSLPESSLWRGKPESVVGMSAEPAANAFPCSTLCRQDSFDLPYFAFWVQRLGLALRYHRKLWEHVFICQALWERGAIHAGARGLGFGVGREPLAAFFASENCSVVATDMALGPATALGWSETVQHAWGLEALRHGNLCTEALFSANVSFRECDMNHVPDDLDGFDFCWSACALEHLGSIAQGEAFIERSLACLKPGGWAIHTTEFNLSSNNHTLDVGGTVLFRKRDLESLADTLRRKGHEVAPFEFQPGLGPMDRYIDVAPYREEPHLKLAVAGYATTSIGIIVRRAS